MFKFLDQTVVKRVTWTIERGLLAKEKLLRFLLGNINVLPNIVAVIVLDVLLWFLWCSLRTKLRKRSGLLQTF